MAWICDDCGGMVNDEAIVWECEHPFCDDEFCGEQEPFGHCRTCGEGRYVLENQNPIDGQSIVALTPMEAYL